MQLTRHTEAGAWDNLLHRLGGHPLQAWAWGSLKERFGWQAHRLSVGDDAAAQLLIRPFRGLAAAYVPRGPLLGDDEVASAALVDALIRLARSQRAAFIRLEPDVLEDDAAATRRLAGALGGHRFRAVQHTLQPRSSIRLDVARTDEELLAGFSKGHRADVRRAEREGVRVRAGRTDADADVLHQMMRASQQRKEFGIHTPAYYRTLWRLYGDDAQLLLADHDGQPVAASLILAFAGHAVYLAAGATRAGLDVRASHLLQWHALRWARERGAQSYDLWGIPDARGRLALAAEGLPDDERARLEQAARSDPLDGVYRFKKGWGGQVVRTVPALDRVFFAPAYWFWRWRRSEA